eukprot:11175194-Lingulodinium_polyedra.AAC.2
MLFCGIFGCSGAHARSCAQWLKMTPLPGTPPLGPQVGHWKRQGPCKWQPVVPAASEPPAAADAAAGASAAPGTPAAPQP